MFAVPGKEKDTRGKSENENERMEWKKKMRDERRKNGYVGIDEKVPSENPTTD